MVKKITRKVFNMKKLWSLVLLLVTLCVFAVAGCGGKDPFVGEYYQITQRLGYQSEVLDVLKIEKNGDGYLVSNQYYGYYRGKDIVISSTVIEEGKGFGKSKAELKHVKGVFEWMPNGKKLKNELFKKDGKVLVDRMGTTIVFDEKTKEIVLFDYKYKPYDEKALKDYQEKSKAELIKKYKGKKFGSGGGFGSIGRYTVYDDLEFKDEVPAKK